MFLTKNHKTISPSPILIVLIIFLLHTYNFDISSQTIKGTIGFSLADLSIARWDNDRDYFVWSAKALGYNVIVTNADNNCNTQIKQTDSLLKLGIRALVIVPVDGLKAAIIVENAHKYGVKVIAYDRIILNSDLDAYISYDNELVGEIMAIYMTIKVNKGNFMYIGGPSIDQNSVYIRQGVMKIMSNFITNGDVRFVCDTFVKQWNENESYKIVNEYLNSGKPVPEVIYAANDALALGAINALEEKQLDKKVLVTGQDADLIACKNLILGKQALTIFKPIRTIADRAVMITAMTLGDINYVTSKKVFNGKKSVPAMLLNPVPVDKGNLRNTIIIDGYHTEEELYK